MKITMVLSSPPYCGQDADTVLGLARAALDRGHEVKVVASGDGVYGLIDGQNASGAPHVAKEMAALMNRGLGLEL